MNTFRGPQTGNPATRGTVGLVFAFLLAVLVTLFTGDVAHADCIGPTVGNTGGDLAHGDLVTVTGYGFGDNCYDTGPPPPGEGSLGRPLTGIEVYFEQDGRLFLAASGNADDDYIWEVQVAIPAVLDVGEAHVVVMNDGLEAFNENPAEIWVTSDREEEAFFEPVAFGPPAKDLAEASPEMPFRGTDWTPVIALVAAAVTAVGAFGRFAHRSTTRPATSESSTPRTHCGRDVPGKRAEPADRHDHRSERTPDDQRHL